MRAKAGCISEGAFETQPTGLGSTGRLRTTVTREQLEATVGKSIHGVIAAAEDPRFLRRVVNRLSLARRLPTVAAVVSGGGDCPCCCGSSCGRRNGTTRTVLRRGQGK